MAICAECSGNKYILVSYNCPHCDGTGEIVGYDRHGKPLIRTCPNCDHGRIYVEEPCNVCQGTGII